VRSIVPAVNSLRAGAYPHRVDLWATPALVLTVRGDPDADGRAPGNGSRGLLPCNAVLGSGALQVGADVLEDLAHDWAKENQGHDHDDRDEGQEQTVLDERLTFLILAAELGQKSDDELNHSFEIPPFLTDLG